MHSGLEIKVSPICFNFQLHTRMVYEERRFSKNHSYADPSKHFKQLDGTSVSPYGWKSAHIEGRGRYLDEITGR